MNKTRYIPSIVMLSAALVACVATMYFKYSTRDILIIVLVASIVFFIIGQMIRMLAEKYLIVETVKETVLEEQENENEDKDNADSGNTESGGE